MRFSASSILRISLRSRSRVRSSRLNSSSCVARSFGIREVGRFVLHVRDGAVDFFHEVALPALEDLAEVRELLLVHVRLTTLGDVRRYIAGAREQTAGLGDSSPSLSPAAFRAAVDSPLAPEGTPFAVTTMRSEGGVLRIACATGVELAAAIALATGAGLTAGTGLTAGAAGLAAGGGLRKRGISRRSWLRRVSSPSSLRSTLVSRLSWALQAWQPRAWSALWVAPGPDPIGGRFAGRGIIPASFRLYSGPEKMPPRRFFT